jgi:hypothetical protein
MIEGHVVCSACAALREGDATRAGGPGATALTRATEPRDESPRKIPGGLAVVILTVIVVVHVLVGALLVVESLAEDNGLMAWAAVLVIVLGAGFLLAILAALELLRMMAGSLARLERR